MKPWHKKKRSGPEILRDPASFRNFVTDYQDRILPHILGIFFLDIQLPFSYIQFTAKRVLIIPYEDMQVRRTVEVGAARLVIKVVTDSDLIARDRKNRVIEEANQTGSRKTKEVMSEIFIEE